jgi:hypothetical protein
MLEFFRKIFEHGIGRQKLWPNPAPECRELARVRWRTEDQPIEVSRFTLFPPRGESL